jgi:hypothetical protein
LSHTLKARCIRRYPPADRTEPGKQPVHAQFVLAGNAAIGEVRLTVHDPLLQAYLQEGKEYDLALSLTQPGAKG